MVYGDDVLLARIDARLIMQVIINIVDNVIKFTPIGSDEMKPRVFMATLRKKLESEPNSPQYIQTHIGAGYRMMKVE